MAKVMEETKNRVDTGAANFLYEVVDGILTIQIDTLKSFGRCQGTKPKDAPEGATGPFGKNIKVSSTGGNQTIDQMTGLQIGVNVFRAPNDKERAELWAKG